jgi:hypothetical protein
MSPWNKTLLFEKRLKFPREVYECWLETQNPKSQKKERKNERIRSYLHSSKKTGIS